MKYFRYYPWGMQLLLFFLMVLVFYSLTTMFVIGVVPGAFGVPVQQLFSINEQSPYGLIVVSQYVQGISSITLFLIPSLLFAYLTHPHLREYLGLRMPGKSIQFLLVIIMMLGAIPVLTAIESLISLIDFGPAIRKSQLENNSMMTAFLTMHTPADFVRTFIIMAIVPAAGEELFFRGVMMKFTAKKTKRIWGAIIFTSALFAYSHSNIYGLLSIFLAGALLAGIYYITGSLWCSILAHTVFNGTQVVLSYLANSNAAVKSLQNSDKVEWWLVAAGAVVFSVSFYLLWRNRTPLTPDWTNDFADMPPATETGEEIQ